jgi:hypothetical protein
MHSQAKIYQVVRLSKVRAIRAMHLPAREVYPQAKIYQVGKLQKVRFSSIETSDVCTRIVVPAACPEPVEASTAPHQDGGPSFFLRTLC